MHSDTLIACVISFFFFLKIMKNYVSTALLGLTPLDYLNQIHIEHLTVTILLFWNQTWQATGWSD